MRSGIMTQQNMFDPFVFWKAMYETAESNFSQAIDETLRKEEYAEFLGNLQSGYLQYQQLIQSTTDTYLKQMNMPTRDEISSIASLIINLEEKVENIHETIEEEELSVSSEIKNLKTSVNRLDRKLNQILQELKSDDASTKSTAEKEK